MKRMGVMFLTVCLAMFFLIPATMAEEKWYVGSEKCADCHMDNFNDWQASGHPYKLRRAEKVRYP
ncbi:MAG: hypothetical protein HOB38_28220 [Deltaproteobacteria bacterium]|nr:hypothetical protein [Deltaproteobacteria bacterium]